MPASQQMKNLLRYNGKHSSLGCIIYNAISDNVRWSNKGVEMECLWTIAH